MECPIRKEEKLNRCTAKNLPLSGQTFFLCLRRKRLNEEQLQQRIENLGGKLEKFFNNEVTCVLTDEPVNGKNGESEKSAKDEQEQGISKDQKKSYRRLNINEKAIMWGKKLWKIDKFLIWIRNQEQCKKVPVNVAKRYVGLQKRLKPLHTGTRLPVHLDVKQDLVQLQEPFIKIENVNGQFRPYHKVFVSEPAICVRKLYPRSPFDDDKEQLSFLKRLKNVDSRKSSQPAKRRPVAKIKRPQRQYCECCNIYFQNLEHHLQGPKHRQFSTEASNFECITEILEDLEKPVVFRDEKANVLSPEAALSLAIESCSDSNVNSLDFAQACGSQTVLRLGEKEMKTFKCSSPHLLPFCSELSLNFDTEINGYCRYDGDERPVSLVHSETICLPDFDFRQGSNASIGLLVDDPFLSCFDGSVFKKCADLNASENKLDISGLHISLGSPEVFGNTDPMFSDKSTDDDDDLDLQCFLNSIVKDNWMDDVPFTPVPQTSTQESTFHSVQPLRTENNFVLPNANCKTPCNEFWPEKSQNDQHIPTAFPYDKAYMKYNWSVKYRSDTKIVILRTQKAIGVR